MAEQKYTIRDIIETYISGDWGNDEPTEEASCPVSCIRGADIVPIYNSEFNNIPLRYISEKSLANRALQEGDIVIEKSGGSPTQSTGRVVYISKELLEEKQDIVCSNFCAAFRIKPEWDAKYVYYYLQHIYNAGVFFNFEGKTSGLKNLIMDTAFKSITIKKIAIETQRSIATVLSTIESKMAANRAINHYLEAMAKQLYDYWFVQFDFPDANGRPYKSSGGKMVWNEKVKKSIPEGWDVMPLQTMLSDTKSGDWGKDENENGLMKVSCIRGTDINELNDLPIRYISNKHDDRLLSPDDIVIEISGGSPTQSTGRIALITEGVLKRNNKHVICSNFCHCYVLKDKLFAEYFYYLWTSLYNNGNMFNYEGKTSGIKNFIADAFLANNWCIPPKELVDRFHNIVLKYHQNRDVLIEENNIMLAEREELLPLLMTGQVSVMQLNNDLSNN